MSYRLRYLGTQDRLRRGEIRRTPISDDMAGIMFEVEQMKSDVKKFSKDPLVMNVSKIIVSERAVSHNKRSMMEAIFDWMKKRVFYVWDPVDTEVLTTPLKMMRDMAMPRQVIEAVLDPEIQDAIMGRKQLDTTYDNFCKGGCKIGITPLSVAMAEGKASEDCDGSAVFLASMFSAVGITSRFRFGALNGARKNPNWQHVWAQGQDDFGEWVNADITENESTLDWMFNGFQWVGKLDIF